MTPPPVLLEDLFNYSKIDHRGASWAQWTALMLWTPVGLVLCALRLLLLVPLLAAVATVGERGFPAWLSRLLLPVFGLSVSVSSGQFAGDRCHAVVCNHRSGVFDCFPFLTLIGGDPGSGCAVRVVLDHGYFRQSWLARRFLEFLRAVHVRSSGVAGLAPDRHAVRHAVLHQEAAAPVLVFSEGWDTNGRGLLLYQKFVFSLPGVLVQPACLTVAPCAWLPLHSGQLGTTPLYETLWLFFSPWTRFDLAFLPVKRARPSETDVEFARRVQLATAKHLGCHATHFTYKDALALRKRILTS